MAHSHAWLLNRIVGISFDIELIVEGIFVDGNFEWDFLDFRKFLFKWRTLFCIPLSFPACKQNTEKVSRRTCAGKSSDFYTFIWPN
jgi:hypothetical protein